MVEDAAVLSGSSFFVSAVLNESVCCAASFRLFTIVTCSCSYGDFILPESIPFKTLADICDFASTQPLLRDGAPSLLKSLHLAYARDVTGILIRSALT